MGSDLTMGAVVTKMQEALDAKYYVAGGNLFEKKCIVSISKSGDLRITSGQHLSTSAIALTAGTSGSANVDELFEAMKKMLNNKKLRLSMGKEGRNYIKKNFLLDNSVNKLIDLYKNC